MNVSEDFSNTPNSHLFRNNTTNSDWTIYTYSAVYALNFIFGLPINSYVLWLIFMGKGSGVVSEFFSLNLTISEMLFCSGGLFYILKPACPKLLVITLFLSGTSICGRPLFLCLICVERYVAVVYPVTFLKFKPLRYRVICSAAVWMVVLGLCIFCVFGNFIDNISLFICVVVPLNLLCFSIMLFCCVAVVRALQYPGPGQRGLEREATSQVKRKAVTVILIITVATVIQYSPILLVGFLYRALTQQIFNILWSVGCMVYLFVGYVHAFLYIYRAG